jgi:hypothetical protein
VNRTFRTPPGPFTSTETASWPLGQVRLVVAALGLTLSVKRLSEHDFEVQHRQGIRPDALEGLPSKARLRRGVEDAEQ